VFLRSKAAAHRVGACIFDLDGTLVDSEPAYCATDRAFLAQYGIGYSEAFSREMMGRGTIDFFRILESRYPESPLNELSLMERIEKRDAAYLESSARTVAAFPAVAGLVDALFARRLPLGLGSGSGPAIIAAEVEAAGLTGKFGALVSAMDVGKSKPHPAIFLEVAARLGVDPRECVVFEDAVVGVEAAGRAGMRCIALPSPDLDLGLFASADRIIRGGPASTTTQALLGVLEELGLSL
jgi:beta-phosphoglucomutase-like phosphatase (HAD superfamily)